MGRPWGQNNRHRTYFPPGRSTGALLPRLQCLSAGKIYILTPPPKKKKSYWIPTPVSFIWKWLTCSAFFESFWLQYLETPLFQELNSICLTCLFTQNQVLFASFHSCTKHTNPPISAGKKGVWGKLFIKQRHFYFIVNTHPGAVVSVITNSHCKKLLHWKDK